MSQEQYVSYFCYILVTMIDYQYYNSKCIKGSSHYLGDKQDFDVSSEGPCYLSATTLHGNISIAVNFVARAWNEINTLHDLICLTKI